MALGLMVVPGGWTHCEPEGGENSYQARHDRLLEAVREGKPFSGAKNGAIAVMAAVTDRMATDSGKKASWEEALESDASLAAATYAWDPTCRCCRTRRAGTPWRAGGGACVAIDAAARSG